MTNSTCTIRTGADILLGEPVRKPVAMTAALAVALATGFFAVPLASGTPEKAAQNAATRFASMDGDNNGQVSREEFFAAQPQMKEGAFAAIDADADGALSLKEWEGFAAGHGKGGMMGGGAPSAEPEHPAPAQKSGEASGKPPSLIMPSGDAR